MAVSILNAWADVGTTSTASGGSFTVSAGAGQRQLFYAAFGQGTSGQGVSAVSYGGRAMTLVVEEAGFDTAGFIAPYASLWRLDEDELALASGTSFTITSDLSSGSYRAMAICLDGVDQTSPIVDSDGASAFANESTTNADLDITLTSVADGIALSALGADLTSGESMSIASPFTTDVTTVTPGNDVNYLGSRATTTTTSVTADVTGEPGDSFYGNAHVALTVRPGGDIIELESTSDASSGSSSDLNISKDLAADVPSSSTASGALQLGFELSGQADAVSGTDAEIPVFVEAVVPSTSGHLATLPKFGTTSAASTSSSTATAVNFSGSRASAASQSSATASANTPEPANPILSLADSFLQRRKAVFMIDMLFDSGELNIWTRNFDGIYEGKEYTALSGVSSGFTFENGLEDTVNDANIQLNGQNQALLNIALTENYRNRVANVYLANAEDTEIVARELIFPAYITNMTVSDNRTESQVTVRLESVFKRVRTPVVRRQRPSDLEKVSLDDSFYDYLATTKATNPTFGDA